MQQFRHNIDLHCHTNISDGRLSPEELLQLAQQNGIELLAISDHDTLQGYRVAKPIAEEYKIKLIPAAEFSCQHQKMNIHLVALNVDPDSEVMKNFENQQENRRNERAHKIANKLYKAIHRDISENFSSDDAFYEYVQTLAGEGVVGRPHFAQALVDQGIVKDAEQAFKKFLGSGKAGDVKLFWPDMGDAIEAIHASGGKAILAHPLKYNMTRSKLTRLIDDFWNMDGDALELISSRQTKDDTGWMIRQIDKRDLSASVGSDFHAANRWSDLGAYSAIPNVQLHWVHEDIKFTESQSHLARPPAVISKEVI